MIVKKNSFLKLLMSVLFFPVFFYIINFDHSENLDIDGYKGNYEHAWNQFEIGYTFLEATARTFELSFEFFWVLVICIELVLIIILYNNVNIFVIAIPNILMLSQGLLGTQVRFGIASLLCLVVFNKLFYKKSLYIFSGVTALFHNGTVIFHFLSFFMKIMINVKEKITTKRNLTRLLVLVFFLILISFLVRQIFLALGYYYYADTSSQHVVTRSLSSMLYTSVVLGFVFCLLNSNRGPVAYPHMVYLGALMLIVSLIFFNFSIVSGRYNLVFMLVEPFILYSYFKTIGIKKGLGFLSFCAFYSVSLSKLITLELII